VKRGLVWFEVFGREISSIFDFDFGEVGEIDK
jgi:hypothetical protein